MIPSFADDTEIRKKLYPFAQIRSVLDIRLGILTIREKWERLLEKFIDFPFSDLPPHLVPGKQWVDAVANGTLNNSNYTSHPHIRMIEFPWQLFEYNDWALREDFALITGNRFSEPIPETVQTVKSTSIFLEPGAQLSHCILNASTGPIYIGKNAEIMEGSVIRGPFALGEGAVVKMGAKIYGATTVGPYSVVGGEIKNALIFGYSNKAHDGYLGDSVIGEWCNLGAGTSNSNLRNTASSVKVWNKPENKFTDAGLKCGLLMGDYSRSAINTAFNTGTVTGVAAHVFGSGLTPKYIPDFAWGMDGNEKYGWEKAVQDISNWKKLKNKELSEQEIQTLKGIFEAS